MIVTRKGRQPVSAHGLRGGTGAAQVLRFLGPEETDGKLGLMNLITLLPGSSIGEHTHSSDGEAYLLVEGEAVFWEDGAETVLHAGDVTYTAHGGAHALYNRSGAPVKLLAVVLN